MPRYLLDTDICIFFLQGKYGLKNKIENAGINNCFVSEISIGELLFGAFNSSNFEKHFLEVEKIQSLFEVVPIYDALPGFAKEKVRLKNKGLLLPDFDLLIGVTATFHDMVMVSNNEKHLSRIDGIQLENWVKSPLI